MTEIRTKLAPPWVTFVNEIKALFGEDPDVGITYDNDEHTVKIYVEDEKKASAFDQLLPKTKEFGNVRLKINVIPANGVSYGYNDLKFDTLDDLFNTAFNKNPVFSFVVSIDCLYSNKITYVVFAKKVVQFFNDNLNDPYGNKNTLYQEIASEILTDIPGVYYATDRTNDTLDQPDRVWP